MGGKQRKRLGIITGNLNSRCWKENRVTDGDGKL